MIMQRLPSFQSTVASSVNQAEEDESKLEQERPLAVLNDNSNNFFDPIVGVARSEISNLSQQQDYTNINYGIFPLMPLSSSQEQHIGTMLPPGRTSPPSNPNNNGNGKVGAPSPVPIRRDGMLQVVEKIPVYSDNRLLQYSQDILDCLGPLLGKRERSYEILDDGGDGGGKVNILDCTSQAPPNKRQRPFQVMSSSSPSRFAIGRNRQKNLQIETSGEFIKSLNHTPMEDNNSSPFVLGGVGGGAQNEQEEPLSVVSNGNTGQGEAVSDSLNPPSWTARASFSSTKASSSGLERAVSDSLAPPPSSTGRASFSSTTSSSGLELTEYQTSLWDRRFQELCVYREAHGNCLVPHNYCNITLAKWVKRQRYQYKLKQDGKHSTLTEERQAKLENLNFIWDSHNAVWEERFGELLEYKRVHGHCNVPSTSSLHTLSVWVQCQRRHYKQYVENKKGNNRSRMSEERVRRLESVGFVWKPRIGRSDDSHKETDR